MGSLSFFLGSKAKYSFTLFWFLKPKYLAVDSFEKLQKKTSRELKRSHLHDFLDNIETGDLFMFVGKLDKGYQVAIKWYTSSPISHVGICYKKDDELLFVEAASSGFKVTDLHEILHHYFTKFPVVIFRKLHTDRDESFNQKFDEFVEDYHNKRYTNMKSARGLLELSKSAIDIRLPFMKRDIFHNHKDLETLFCSELVAEAYGKLGLLSLDEKIPSNEYTPADFSRINEEYTWGPERRRVANLKNGAYLGDEIYVYTELSKQERERLEAMDIKGPKEDVDKPRQLFSDSSD